MRNFAIFIEQRKALAFRCSFYFMTACFAAGCTTVPAAIKDEPRFGGSFAVRGFPFLGLTWIETVSVNRAHNIESYDRNEKRFSQVRCSYLSHEVDIVSAHSVTGGVISTKRLCLEIAQTVAYITNFSKRHPHYDVKIVLVPPSEEYISRSFYLYPLMGKLKFKIPWYGSDPKFSESHVIETVAHETFHVTSRVDRVPKDRRYSEKYAYIAGYCGELDVLGKISLWDSSPNRGNDEMLTQRYDISRSIEGRAMAYRYLSNFDLSNNDTNKSGKTKLFRNCRKILGGFFQ